MRGADASGDSGGAGLLGCESQNRDQGNRAVGLVDGAGGAMVPPPVPGCVCVCVCVCGVCVCVCVCAGEARVCVLVLGRPHQ